MDDAQCDRGGQSHRRRRPPRGPASRARPHSRRLPPRPPRRSRPGGRRHPPLATPARLRLMRRRPSDPEHAGRKQGHDADHHRRLAARPSAARHERAPGGQQERAAEVGEDLRDRHARAEQRRNGRAWRGERVGHAGRAVGPVAGVSWTAAQVASRAQPIGRRPVDQAGGLPTRDMVQCVTHRRDLVRTEKTIVAPGRYAAVACLMPRRRRQPVSPRSIGRAGSRAPRTRR